MSSFVHRKISYPDAIKSCLDLAPGLILCLFIGVLSYFLGQYPLIGGAVFGILFGILIKNTFGTPRQLSAGINFTAKAA